MPKQVQQAAPREGGGPRNELYDRYRVHQKNVFKECTDDARLILKRVLAGEPSGPDALMTLALALFAKRCESWESYRAAQEELGFTPASRL